MTNLLLPQMLSRSGGVIVNLSSATSISVTAQATVYSATKVISEYQVFLFIIIPHWFSLLVIK